MDIVIIVLCIASFLAGFVDAIVGGGGLIQTPVALVVLPNIHVSSIIGTLKIPGFSGTSVATYQYLKKIRVKWKLFAIMAVISFVFAFIGSQTLTIVDNAFMKPVLFFILVGLLIYTYIKKDFGQFSFKNWSNKKQLIYASIICVFIGFYDGFIGPGTGSLLIMAFVAVLGFDFLQASAYAKLVNLATNIGSITLFTIKGKILWKFAIPMAVCNATGAWIGARLAISKGNAFIRIFFLVIVFITLLRFGYDVFIK